MVRQLMVVTAARAAIVSAAPVAEVAGSVFADLVVNALTGRCAERRPWMDPPTSLAASAAVEWARSHMPSLSRDDVRSVVGPGEGALDVRSSWYMPWFVIGDPAVRVYWEVEGGDPS